MSRPYRELSLWHDTLDGDDLAPRPALDGDAEADVCVVGAGYTGLWAAYHLLRARPELRVVVLEQEIAGFGASGRNGGWCSALFPVGPGALAHRYGPDAAVAMRRAMQATVDEIGRTAAEEGIDCHFAKGGTVAVARSEVQLARARAELAADEALGGVDEVRLLSAAEAGERLGATRVLGGLFTPHCARIQPARLARGLAAAVERRGGILHEGTRVTGIRSGATGPEAVTSRGTVRARHVLRATEAWTAQLPGSERDVVPVYSLMIATEPLPAAFWDAAGLRERETFTDLRHLIVYGQRTADDRLAFGGRGAPYHFGSRIDPASDRAPEVFEALRRTLTGMFPALADHAVTHTWGGPLGIARDWSASVGLDRTSGIGWAGGYVGDGVGTTHLAGATLADLVLGRDTERTRLPWVNHRSRRWEPEPLRWLGINAGLRAMTVADAEERRTHRPSVAARVMAPFLGH